MARVRWGTQWGYIDRKGKLVIPCSWEEAHDFQDDIALVSRGGKWGILDKQGNTVQPCQWTELKRAFPLCKLFRVSRGGKFGILDPTGKLVHDCIFEDINLFYDTTYDYWRGDYMGYFGDGKAYAVKQDGKWGFISREDGRWISRCQWDGMDEFRGGLSRVCQEGKMGAIDEAGNQIIPCIWEKMDKIKETGLIRVMRKAQWLYLDREGKVAISQPFEYLGPFEGKVAKVKLDGKWGYCDQAGTLYSPRQIPRHLKDYRTCYHFFRDLAWVSLNGKVGFIDYDGNEVIPCQWDRAHITDKGLIQVQRGYELGLLRRDGTQVYPCRLNWIGPFRSGMAIAEQDGKRGIIDLEGNVLLPFQWDYVTDFRKYDLALVRLGDKWGIVDRAGQLVQPCTLSYWDSFHLREKLLAEQ